jgi:nitrite reductase/ring-hydroxylating ferredoxin subunit
VMASESQVAEAAAQSRRPTAGWLRRHRCGQPANLNDPSRRDEAPAGEVDAGSAQQLLAAGRMVAFLGDIEVLVLRTRRGFFAVENHCPHVGRVLSDGAVSGRKLICAGHGHGFDLASGMPAGPRTGRRRLRTFDATVIDGRLWLSAKVTT